MVNMLLNPNNHTEFIGKGVPNRRSRVKDFTRKLATSDVPPAEEAVQQFSSMGGQLTIFSPFGRDPLEDAPALVAQRDVQFSTSTPPFSTIFHAIANGNDGPFRSGLQTFINLTERLTP